MRTLAAAALASLALACGHRPALRPPPPIGAEEPAPQRPPPPAAAAALPPAAPARPPPAQPDRAGTPPLDPAEPHIEPELLGVTHVVKKGETIYRIARTYGIEPRDLLEVNELADPRQLRPGMELFVPGARRKLEVAPLATGALPEAPEPEEAPSPPAPAPSAAAAPRGDRPALRWPLKGLLYSRFGIRQGQRHDGIDLAAPEGSTVTAAADGSVVYAGQQPGYGHVVILRHAGGLLTLYAHNAVLLVAEGAKVKAGEAVARVGQSGKTTGPHLHFEVREGTRPRDPLLYLK